MQIHDKGKQYRNLVGEMLDSPDADKFYDCVREILTELGYDEHKLTYYLRSKFISLDLKPTTVDVIIKGNVAGTIEVEEFKAKYTRIFTCRIQNINKN